MKIGILGAGLAGIELGRRLKGAGRDFVIFEKESQVGGLCRTNKTGDYYWDFAVHAIYSRSIEVMDYFYALPIEYKKSNRDVKVVHRRGSYKKYIIDYPFENGVIDLPAKDKLECILGYVAARIRRKEFHNLREWIDNRVGFGIAKHFMIPYNNKIWNSPLSEISDELVASKIEPTTAVDFIKGALWKKTVGREYQSKFIYPQKGIQEFIDYTAKDILGNILLHTPVVALARQGSGWIITGAGGTSHKVDMVISTIPLTELLRMIDIEGIKKEYEELRWNNTYFVMVGLKEGSRFQHIDSCHWVFFAGDEIFYRLTLMHNFNDTFPAALVAEVTDKGEVLGKTQAQVQEFVIEDLLRLGLVRARDEIVQVDTKRIEYTYTIPTVGLSALKSKIKSALEPHNLFLLGRSGNWDYINMDGVVLKVKELFQRFPNG